MGISFFSFLFFFYFALPNFVIPKTQAKTAEAIDMSTFCPSLRVKEPNTHHRIHVS